MVLQVVAGGEHRTTAFPELDATCLILLQEADQE
jgi:hypothetical protein